MLQNYETCHSSGRPTLLEQPIICVLVCHHIWQAWLLFMRYYDGCRHGVTKMSELPSHWLVSLPRKIRELKFYKDMYHSHGMIVQSGGSWFSLDGKISFQERPIAREGGNSRSGERFGLCLDRSQLHHMRQCHLVSQPVTRQDLYSPGRVEVDHGVSGSHERCNVTWGDTDRNPTGETCDRPIFLRKQLWSLLHLHDQHSPSNTPFKVATVYSKGWPHHDREFAL